MAKRNDFGETRQLLEAAISGAKEERERVIEIIKQPSRLKPGSLPKTAQKDIAEAIRLIGFEKTIEALIVTAIMNAKKQIIEDIESGKLYEELAQEKGWEDKSKGWTYYEDK